MSLEVAWTGTKRGAKYYVNILLLPYGDNPASVIRHRRDAHVLTKGVHPFMLKAANPAGLLERLPTNSPKETREAMA